MRNSLRFGIIGCSSIAERITIPSIVESKYSILENIGSRSTIKAKKFSKKFNSNSNGNYEDVLNDKNTDAVYISLPTGLQEKWIIKAANSQKHILCEKPMSINDDECKKASDYINKSNIFFMEAIAYRLHPQTNNIIKIINNNEIGKINSIKSSFGFVVKKIKPDSRLFNKSFGGGAILDLGCYPLSFISLYSYSICNVCEWWNIHSC